MLVLFLQTLIEAMVLGYVLIDCALFNTSSAFIVPPTKFIHVGIIKESID